MRIDKYLSDCNIATRSELKKIIRNKQVTVNDVIVSDPGFHVNDSDVVSYKGQVISYSKYMYIILNKPAGVVTAREDKNDRTVMDLIHENYKDLSPVGRLDKDTEGFLLITNDGMLNHNMLSPAKHVDKSYFVRLETDICDGDINSLENGVNIGDKDITMPAVCSRISGNEVILTICEGRFHQVKRMMEAVGNKVIYLKRLSFGPLQLPDDLSLGEYRFLNEEEMEMIKGYR